MSLMLSDSYTLGIDIGGTHFRLGLVSEAGELFALEKRSTETLTGGAPTARLGDAILDYMCRNGVEKRVVSVCIGFPATVDKARVTVLSAPNVQGFDGVPVGKLLSERLSMPVYIERDVNLLLLEDLQHLDVQSSDVIACYVGTGIGNAILLGGQLLVGHNGVAGELGHIPFGDADAPCGCGNSGCAEPLAGGVYLARLCRETFCDTPIAELFLRHRAHPLLAAYMERLGRVIATEVNLIDPEVVLLGGGVIEMQGFPKGKLEQSILAHARKPFPHDHLKIRYSVARNGVLGAGILAWRRRKT